MDEIGELAVPQVLLLDVDVALGIADRLGEPGEDGQLPVGHEPVGIAAGPRRDGAQNLHVLGARADVGDARHRAGSEAVGGVGRLAEYAVGGVPALGEVRPQRVQGVPLDLDLNVVPAEELEVLGGLAVRRGVPPVVRQIDPADVGGGGGEIVGAEEDLLLVVGERESARRLVEVTRPQGRLPGRRVGAVHGVDERHVPQEGDGVGEGERARLDLPPGHRGDRIRELVGVAQPKAVRELPAREQDAVARLHGVEVTQQACRVGVPVHEGRHLVARGVVLDHEQRVFDLPAGRVLRDPPPGTPRQQLVVRDAGRQAGRPIGDADLLVLPEEPVVGRPFVHGGPPALDTVGWRLRRAVRGR